MAMRPSFLNVKQNPNGRSVVAGSLSADSRTFIFCCTNRNIELALLHEVIIETALPDDSTIGLALLEAGTIDTALLDDGAIDDHKT